MSDNHCEASEYSTQKLILGIGRFAEEDTMGIRRRSKFDLGESHTRLCGVSSGTDKST